MAAAGYGSHIYKEGTPTGMAGEALSLVSGKTYRITDRAKRLLDPTVAITVYDNASPVSAANIESIDLLLGKVTFVSGYTVVGAITMDATYIPLTLVTTIRSFNFDTEAGLVENTTFVGSAHPAFGYKTRQPTIGDYSLSFSLWDDITEEFAQNVTDGDRLVFVVGPGNDPASADVEHFRARVIFESFGKSAEVGGLVEDSYSAQGSATTSVDGYPVAYSEGV